ncbi:hypothetical protein T484DRAFT_3502724 [Baffinella frigidus]|nr:hypothetical protein T484DRAFT_3502724 [Cryptophyta sp. CCMP2293]
MVGTLLVCLPCSHSGGALVVKHNAEEVRFDFAAESGRGGAIQWAALYSDCLHNVETVTSGCRVTVSYSILARKGHPTAHGHGTPSSCLADHLTHAAWPPATAPLLSAVAGRLEALRDDASRPQSAVGMYLNHMYTSAALNPAGLKGADRMLYTHVAEKWGVTLMHVVEKVHEKAENSDDERAPEDFESEYDNQVFAFSAPDLDRLASGARGPAPGCEGLQDVAFVKPWSAKMVLQETTHRTAGGNQGNWYENGSKEIDSLYLHAALIVRLDQPALPT